ncbi:MAG: hypothetical protein KFF50_15715, partial [Desulfatitalea sp.]|nr:hypothetical protein [Desulfatitalea sp.]
MAASITAMPAAVWRRLDKELWVKRLLIVLACLWLLVVVVLPLGQLLSKSLTDRDGQFVGLANYVYYFNTPALSDSLYNSLFVSAMTTVLAVSLGLLYAYGLTRAVIPAKGVFKSLAMLPLFAPTLLNGIALIYLFGRQGLVTRGFFEALPGIDIGVYGPVGIIIAETLYTFPQAV